MAVWKAARKLELVKLVLEGTGPPPPPLPPLQPITRLAMHMRQLPANANPFANLGLRPPRTTIPSKAIPIAIPERHQALTILEAIIPAVPGGGIGVRISCVVRAPFVMFRLAGTNAHV
jgi:hypothetical protein